MAERPNWLKIVGGKDHKPDADKAVPDSLEQTEEKVTDSELVGLFMGLRENQPADLMARVNKRLIAEESQGLGAWTVTQLHTYLSQPTVWARPSRTVAVFEEIRERMLRGTLEPRE